VQKLKETGELLTFSNVQFGEGGAGTFSDGKLFSGVSSPKRDAILRTFVKYGAPASILYEAHPHIGTDHLRKVVRNMRAAHNTTPVIMLTARDGTEDKIKGLDCGADDYLTKPFIPGELLARVRAVSRRQGEVVLNELQFEDVKLDLSNYTIRTEQRSINLGPKEFDIMRMLMFSPNVIVPKEDILVKVWGTESDAEDNNVEVYISFLRKKLKHLTSHVQIATIRRIGYRLEVNPDC
jgi:DNA-binding response OmpR family regulator